MRPVYLEFCGINSFSEKAEIDFTKLLDGGLFGIFGDTGSGKSTILDCIHFALYGKIERSSGTDSINYKCDKAYVMISRFWNRESGAPIASAASAAEKTTSQRRFWTNTTRTASFRDSPRAWARWIGGSRRSWG